MTDNFSLLNEPRRPWIDPDLLKQKFLALATEAHPDKQSSTSDAAKSADSRRYVDLNAAYNCLAEPKLRLLHLLDLERGAKPKDIQQIPPALADLFAEVANTCRSADTFLAEKSKVTSPLLQVQLFERAQEWIEKLNLLQRKLNELRDQLTSELKSLDAAWMAKSKTGEQLALLDGLEKLYRLFSYFNRWSNQIQKRIIQLTL